MRSIGRWQARDTAPEFTGDSLLTITTRSRDAVHIVRDEDTGAIGVALEGEVTPVGPRTPRTYELLATLPGLYPEWLGERSFCEAHGVRFPYVVGEMANAITTVGMVVAMSKAGMLGFFGAGGLGLARVEAAVDELSETLGAGSSWGINLIHSPNESSLEDNVADLFIRRGVQRVCASAFMALTPAVVRCSAAGLSLDASGRIVRARHMFAKISRPEVARHFMAPAPAEMLHALVSKGKLTEAEAALAARIPVAEDITVEGDSGGHTDNQTLTALFPTILRLRDELVQKHGYTRPIRVGAAGGLGTPGAVAAAFALGAAYVVTGSVNQAAVESGLSLDGKKMLAQAGLGDVMMAPAADMFELGVTVQVLKRGTMFGVRAAKLYDVYVAHPSLEELPPAVRKRVEEEVLHTSIDGIWKETQRFWADRDPSQLARADRDPKHRMALVFRWYLGMASRWAITGEPSRRTDFQIWCGPAMGSFNAWTRGSFLDDPSQRSVVQIARNLMEGAATVTRAHQLRTYGVPVPSAAFDFRPRPLA